MAPDSTLEEIARKVLGVETLTTRNSDGLDFHELAVWNIQAALQAAFEAGARDYQSATFEKRQLCASIASKV